VTTSKVEESASAGVLLLDKPRGPTSFAMVRQVRRILGIRKVGHAGTLDPFATGLLVICVGRRATRLSEALMDGDKKYAAVLQLGVETDTQDPEGGITATRPVGDLEPGEIDECLRRFTGRQLQLPPSYSALKHKGKPLYYYARRGMKVRKEPREIEIHSIKLIAHERRRRRLRIEVACGRGTYIRTLAADIGRALGCGAHLAALRRLQSGHFSVEGSVAGDRLHELGAGELREALIPAATVEEMLNRGI